MSAYSAANVRQFKRGDRERTKSQEPSPPQLRTRNVRHVGEVDATLLDTDDSRPPDNGEDDISPRLLDLPLVYNLDLFIAQKAR